MKRDKLIILIFMISLVIFIFVYYLNSSLVLEREEIVTTLTVGDKTGFDTNTTVLTFGIITAGIVNHYYLKILII